jgi:hypothetical protein
MGGTGRRPVGPQPARYDCGGVRDGYAFAGRDLVPGAVGEDQADLRASPFYEFRAVECGRVRIVRRRLGA